MEFYLHNKDDRKTKSAVNLATTFKIDDANYIIYYNTEVAKSVIDIYIGKISYGDQCLVINKIDIDKQSKFLEVVKNILASKEVETEISDYANIIDTAIIVLDSVQKIQIPTDSLELLKKYHNNEVEIKNDKDEVSTIDTTNNQSMSIDEIVPVAESDKQLNDDVNSSQIIENNIMEPEKNVDSQEDTSFVDSKDSFIGSSDKLTGLDNLLNSREDKKKEKKEKKKVISTPILVLFIVVVIAGAILYFFGNMSS